MLRDPDELQPGQTCYLYPHTRTASQNVHRMLAVSVLKDPKAHWPMVVVGWKQDGTDLWELVHKDNIRLRSPAARTKADDRQGDSVGSGGGTTKEKWQRVRVMPKQPKADIDPDMGDQMELF